MRRLVTALAASMFLLSCSGIPDVASPDIRDRDRIIFSDRLTKAWENSDSLYVNCVVGKPGVSERTVFNVSFSGEEELSGNQYWPPTDPGYKFYASNVPLNPGSSGPSLTCDTDMDNIDIVVASCLSPEYRAVNELVFEHIFAKTGICTAAVPAGYAISGLSVTFSPAVSGKYNLFEGYGKNDGSGWSDIVAGDSVLMHRDMLLIPGEYLLDVSYTLSRGSYAEKFTKMAKATFAGGFVNNLTLVIPEGNDIDVTFRVMLSAWTMSKKYQETI